MVTHILIFAVSSSGSSRLETGLLLNLRLGAVLVQELEQLSSSVLVQSVSELRDRRRNLETLVQDGLLALEADIFRPFHEASEVSLGTDVLAC